MTTANPRELPEGIVYESLKKRHKEIRLLHLDAASNLEDTLHGTLRHAKLGPDAGYCALSYQWGQDKEDRSKIEIEYERYPDSRSTHRSSPIYTHSIGSSLARALRHLRQKYGSVVIWTDALCIDQNNKKEKSWQVPLMGQVYTYAEVVHAWLGPQYNDKTDLLNSIEVAFDSADSFWNLADRIFPQHDELSEKDWLALCVAVTSPHESSDPTHRPYTEFATRLRRAALADSSLRQNWASINDLSKNKYWSRMWILQEAGRARELIFHWGLRRSSHRRILLALGLANSLRESDDVPQAIQAQLSGFDVRFLGALSARATCTQKAPLKDVLAAAYFSTPPLHQAGMKQDLIYARLGLAESAAGIEVDYEHKSVGDVFTDTSRFLLERGFVDSLAAFKPYKFQQEISREGLPSWVYDWSKKGFNSFENFDAAKGTSPQLTVSLSKRWNRRQALKITGIGIGEIDFVNERFSVTVLESGLDKKTIALGSLRAASEPLSEENKQLLVRRIEAIYDQLGLKILEGEIEALSTYRSFPFASFWCWWIYWVLSLVETMEKAEVLLPNQSSPQSIAELLSREESDEGGEIGNMRQYGTKAGLVALVDKQRRSKLLLTRNAGDDSEEHNALQIAQSLFLSAWGMRPAVLNTGRLGYVPEDTGAHDQVVILHGVKAPLVVRKAAGDAYVIIGPAHICGAMQGQLMDTSLSGSKYKLV